MVAVADRERLGQGEVVRDVLALVIAHYELGVNRAVGGDVRREPAVHQTAVPGPVLDGPGVARRGDRLGARQLRVEMPRQQVAVRVVGIGLVENRLPAGLDQDARVSEAADAGKGAEVVIERSVLLHQDDHVLDVARRAAAANAVGQRSRQVRAEERRGDGSTGRPGGRSKQATTRDLGHRSSLSGCPASGRTAAWDGSRVGPPWPRFQRSHRMVTARSPDRHDLSPLGHGSRDPTCARPTRAAHP